MTSNHILSLGLQLLWLSWMASSVIVVRRQLPVLPRASGFFGRPVRLLLAVSCALILAAFFWAYRVDSSGLMLLSGAGDAAAQWKGTAGRAMVELIRRIIDLPPFQIIAMTRCFLLPAAVVLAVVSASVVQRNSQTPHGNLLGALSLILTPSFCLGILGVFNFWFVTLLVMAILMAFRDVTKRPGLANRGALVTGVALLALSRPELMASAVALTVVILIYCRRRRDMTLAALALVLVGVEVALAPQVFGYLFERMRHQPLLMGSDVVGDAPAWQLPLVALRRILASAARNLFALGVIAHAFGFLALWRIVVIVRRRAIEWPELAALTLLLVECLAIGIHREGFIRFIKYGQLVIVPLWYLALCCVGELQSLRSQRRALAAMATSACALLILAAGFSSSGVGRHSLAIGRSVAAQRADVRLLWRQMPQLARELCSSRTTDAGPPRVLVIGLDERSGEEMPGESERWPITHQLQTAGCATSSVFPDIDEALDLTLFGDGSRQGALCSTYSWSPGAEASGATHALITYYDASRRQQVSTALARSHSGACRFRRSGEARLDSASLVVRAKRLPPAATDDTGGELPSHPAHRRAETTP